MTALSCKLQILKLVKRIESLELDLKQMIYLKNAL